MVDSVQVKKVEKLKGLERKIVVEIPSKEVNTACEHELAQLAKTQTMKGFRKGKVPMSVLKKRFGADVRQDVVNKLMEHNFYLAVMKEKLQPASAPSLVIDSELDADPLVFSAVFEIYPEMKVLDFKSLKVTRTTATVDDAAVTNMLAKLQQQHGEWQAASRAAQDGDQLNIDFVGKLKGELFEGGSATGANIEIGAGQFIPGFEEGLLGLKANDTKDLKLKFPKDYHAKEMAGKTVLFEVKVNTVSEKSIPKLNEDFVKKMGISSGKLEDLKTEIETTMLREAKKATQIKVKQELFNALIAKSKFDVPNSLIDSEVNALQEDMRARMQQYAQAGQQLPEMPREHFEQQATKRVKIGLLLNEIVKNEEIKVDSTKLQEKIGEMAAHYQDPQEVINWYDENEEQRRKLESAVLEDQVVDVMLEQVKLKDNPVSYEELMDTKST